MVDGIKPDEGIELNEGKQGEGLSISKKCHHPPPPINMSCHIIMFRDTKDNPPKFDMVLKEV